MAEKSKKPAIRFAGFTEAWEQRKLGDIVDRVVRKNTNNESMLALTISAQYGLVDQITYFNNRVASRDLSNYFLVLNGEFAYNKSTSDGYPFGAVKRLDLYDKGVLSTLYIVFVPKSELSINSDFLTVFFDTDRWHKDVSERAAEGARNHGLLNISAEDFFDIDLVISKYIEEQKQIGELFRSFDNLITLHQRKYDKLVNVKKAMLEKMFPKDGADVPEIRFKGFTEAWEQRKLSGLANETNGGGTPKTSVDSYWNGNIPWIQSSDIKENEVLAVDIKKTISQEAISNSATKLIPKNSIAIVTRVGVGKLAIIPFSYTTSQDFLSLSGLKTDLVFTAYLLYKKMQSDLNSVQGTAIKGITKEELLNKNILLPELAEQDLIGKYFQQLDNLITLHQRKLLNLV